MHRRPALGTSTAVFIMSGIVPYFLYSKIASYVAGSIGGNRALLTLPPVKLHDVIVARTVLESATYIFVGCIVFFAMFMDGITEAVPYDLLPVMEAAGIAITLGVGVGMINLVIMSYFHNWMTFFGFISTPLWFFSGLWYIPEEIPEPYRGYILYNPLLHVIMLARSGFYRELKLTLLDMPYLLGFAGITLAVGLAMVRTARRRILAPI
jgi:capsular polysaccharide transport system permease protein